MRGVNETRGRRLPLHHQATTTDGHRHSSVLPVFPGLRGIYPSEGKGKRERQLRSPYSHFLSPQLSPCRIARFRGAYFRGANIAAVLRASLFFKETTSHGQRVMHHYLKDATRLQEKASLRSGRDSDLWTCSWACRFFQNC